MSEIFGLAFFYRRLIFASQIKSPLFLIFSTIIVYIIVEKIYPKKPEKDAIIVNIMETT